MTIEGNDTQTSPNGKPLDDSYLEIWKIEQEHTRTRWTVATFFFSVSFAVFGLSFQSQETTTLTASHIQRLVGASFYWFAYLQFLLFNRYTIYLRKQLKKMEESNLVTFHFQTEASKSMYPGFARLFTATRLLLYFGLLYTIGTVLLMVFPI